MKVKIGPYINFIGPYQIAEFITWPIRIFMKKDEWGKRGQHFSHHVVGKFLASTWLNPFTNWIHEKRKRTVKIKIHDYDLWSLDDTLAMIILPCLKKYQKDIMGSPATEDADVPEHLKSTNASPKENEWDTDDLWHERWVWIVGEMVWAFEQIVDDEADMQFYKNGEWDKEKLDVWQKRKQNGLMLFGKYLEGLWT